MFASLNFGYIVLSCHLQLFWRNSLSTFFPKNQNVAKKLSLSIVSAIIIAITEMIAVILLIVMIVNPGITVTIVTPDATTVPAIDNVTAITVIAEI